MVTYLYAKNEVTKVIKSNNQLQIEYLVAVYQVALCRFVSMMTRASNHFYVNCHHLLLKKDKISTFL